MMQIKVKRVVIIERRHTRNQEYSKTNLKSEPVHLVAGLGLAAELALKNYEQRNQACQTFRRNMLDFLLPLNPVINGDLEYRLPNAVNLSFVGIDSEALMLALKDDIAISNGSACTSHTNQPMFLKQ